MHKNYNMNKEEFITSISQDGEIWKDIVGWEGQYLVSSYGRVISFKPRSSYGSLLELHPYTVRKKTYYTVYLRNKSRRKHATVHRLVAEAFIPNPNNYPCVDHIDCNSQNNKASNLRWCTYSTNNNNPITLKRLAQANTGIMEGISKKVVQLKNGNVIKIYNSVTETAKFGFIFGCVSNACNGIQKTHKGYEWMFLEDYNKLHNISG